MKVKPTYTHPQETWDEKECLKRSKSAPADYWGNRRPAGLINDVASSHPSYGQRVSYNGGVIIGGAWYQSEEVPLPIIPISYEFVAVPSWGMRIQKNQMSTQPPKHQPQQTNDLLH
jgi:hypothetical protein